MENRKTWFVIHLATKPRQITGPYALEELRIELQRGSIPWTDLMFNQQLHAWKRLFEIPELATEMPDMPNPEKLAQYSKMCLDALSENQKGNAPPASDRLPAATAPVYIQISGHEFGPMSIAEYKSFTQKQDFNEPIYVWYKGLKSWFPIEEVNDAYGVGEAHTQLRKARGGTSLFKVVYGNEVRNSKRSSLVAMVTYSSVDRAALILGVCADISNKGMQVWLERAIDLDVNCEFEIEILPVSTIGVGKVKITVALAWYDRVRLCAGLRFVGEFAELKAYQQLVKYLDKTEV